MTEVVLSSNGYRGGYNTIGYVNGAPVDFEVDTGADKVYLPLAIAEELHHQGKLSGADLRGFDSVGVAGG